METENDEQKCAECDRRLVLGDDVWFVEKCVLGPRGLVPLDEKFVFCRERCITKFFDDDDGLPALPPRLP